LATFICPNCNIRKEKKEVPTLKSMYGLGYEYTCQECRCSISHSWLSQGAMSLGFLILLFINYVGDIAVQVEYGLLIFAVILIVFGLMKLKPQVKKHNK
jgi:hypothetical protein